MSDLHIYTAESRVLHLKDVLRAMLRGAMTGRYAAYRLAAKDIKTEYTRSGFGFLWDFLDPLVLGAVFYFLSQAKILAPGEMRVPYAVFVIYGVLLFQTFADATLFPLNVIRQSKRMLTQLRVTPESLIMSVVYRVLFNSAFRVAVMLVFSVALSAFSPAGFAKFLLLFPGVILAGLSVGVLLAPFNTIYNDVGRVVRIALVPLRFAAPVMYAAPAAPPFSTLFAWNPLTVLISDLRSLATENLFEDPAGFFLRVAAFGALFLVGWFVFHLSIPVLAEQA